MSIAASLTESMGKDICFTFQVGINSTIISTELMDILNKPINSFTFSDVVAFCQEGYREGIQIDYKRGLPQDGLAKYFAAFSNTRGGVIIIGVEEDRQTGIPTAWNGIPNNAQLVERINQWASNVEPIPIYEIHTTDVSNGNVFILIRIFEGDRTPYYVQNDSNLYVRTGNITNLIDQASPDAAELLFGRKEKAELARHIYITQAEEVYEAALERAEKERVRLIDSEKEELRKKLAVEGKQFDQNSYKSSYFSHKVGTHTAMCTVAIQPYYPSKAITMPKELKDSIPEIRVDTRNYASFPSLNCESIPQGVLNFEWSQDDGQVKAEHLYATGLVRFAFDILRPNREGENTVGISGIASMLFSVSKAASNIYQRFGYQGGLKGYISLESTTDVKFVKIVPEGWNVLFDRTKSSLLPSYRWELDLDTSILGNDINFQSFFIEKLKEIYWSLGFEEVREDLLIAYLEKNIGWKPN